MPFRHAVLAVLVPLSLAACAAGPATPERVTLEADLLSVRMSDGSTCLGPAPGLAPETGWSGRLQGCAWDYSYTVEIDPGTNPVRFVLQEVFGALGAGGLLSPIAEVRVTTADGRVGVFQTPERLND